MAVDARPLSFLSSLTTKIVKQQWRKKIEANQNKLNRKKKLSSWIQIYTHI